MKFIFRKCFIYCCILLSISFTSFGIEIKTNPKEMNASIESIVFNAGYMNFFIPKAKYKLYDNFYNISEDYANNIFFDIKYRTSLFVLLNLCDGFTEFGLSYIYGNLTTKHNLGLIPIKYDNIILDKSIDYVTNYTNNSIGFNWVAGIKMTEHFGLLFKVYYYIPISDYLKYTLEIDSSNIIYDVNLTKYDDYVQLNNIGYDNFKTNIITLGLMYEYSLGGSIFNKNDIEIIEDKQAGDKKLSIELYFLYKYNNNAKTGYNNQIGLILNFCFKIPFDYRVHPKHSIFNNN